MRGQSHRRQPSFLKGWRDRNDYLWLSQRLAASQGRHVLRFRVIQRAVPFLLYYSSLLLHAQRGGGRVCAHCWLSQQNYWGQSFA